MRFREFIEKCGKGEYWDPFKKKCVKLKSVRPGFPGFIRSKPVEEPPPEEPTNGENGKKNNTGGNG